VNKKTIKKKYDIEKARMFKLASELSKIKKEK